jgi:diaminopimelate epimerase
VTENKTVIGVKVNMGLPYFEAQKIPAYLPKEEMVKKFHCVEIEVQDKKYKFDLVSLGNPHAVCFVDDVSKIDVSNIGVIVENYKYFPNKTNVEFAQVIDRNNIKIKVWERGVGPTISCGTGACAVVVCAEKRNLCEPSVNVELDGGKLHIDYDKEHGIFLTGGAEFSFEGRLNF